MLFVMDKIFNRSLLTLQCDIFRLVVHGCVKTIKGYSEILTERE